MAEGQTGGREWSVFCGWLKLRAEVVLDDKIMLELAKVTLSTGEKKVRRRHEEINTRSELRYNNSKQQAEHPADEWRQSRGSYTVT